MGTPYSLTILQYQSLHLQLNFGKLCYTSSNKRNYNDHSLQMAYSKISVNVYCSGKVSLARFSSNCISRKFVIDSQLQVSDIIEWSEEQEFRSLSNVNFIPILNAIHANFHTMDLGECINVLHV